MTALKMQLKRILSVEPIIAAFTAAVLIRELEHLKLPPSVPDFWDFSATIMLPICVALFLGHLTDKQGNRKALLLVPIFGQIFSEVGQKFCEMNKKKCPQEVAVVLKYISLLSGAEIVVLMIVLVFILDLKEHKSRVLPLGVAYISCQLSTVIILVLWIFQHVEIWIWELTINCLYVFCIIYGIIWVEDPAKKHIEVNGEDNPGDSFKFVLEKVIAWVMILWIILVHSLTTTGETLSLFYLQSSGTSPLPLGPKKFLTMALVLNLCGTLLALLFYVRIFKISDSKTLIFIILSKITSNVIFAQTKTQMGMYFGLVSGISHFSSAALVVSMTSTMVSYKNYGKAMGLIACFHFLGVKFAIPVYFEGVLRSSNGSFFSAVYTFGAVLYVSCAPMAWWLNSRREISDEFLENLEENKFEDCQNVVIDESILKF